MPAYERVYGLLLERTGVPNADLERLFAKLSWSGCHRLD